MVRVCGPAWLAMSLLACGSVNSVPEDAPPADAPAVDSPPPDTATPDSMSVLRYDVAYVNAVSITPSISSMVSFLQIVNRGTEPLDTAQAEVVMYIDDNPGVDWKFTQIEPATRLLSPGKAAGALSPLAQEKLADAGFASAEVEDPYLNFAFSFPSPPPAGLTLHAEAVIRIAGQVAVLPFLIHVVTDTGDFIGVHRVSSQPMTPTGR